MTAWKPLGIDSEIAALATGRQTSHFAADVSRRNGAIGAALEGRRVMVVGAAGSIGSATTARLAGFRPACLHVFDQSENNLAELTRDLRGQPGGLPVADYRSLPLDYGSEIMGMVLRDLPPYDVVLNFAALKHVRSEKDPYSLLQMLDTNLFKHVRFLSWLAESGFRGRYFAVSTDKAANPTSLMGASKRLMEHVIFSPEVMSARLPHVTSARFANVAFSDGSLPFGYMNRLRKRQPLAAPRDTRRYFVSLEEAAEICLLAAFHDHDRDILVPHLSSDVDLIPMQTVAEGLLRHLGLTPALYEDEAAAVAAIDQELAQGRYPLLLTPLDTSGEKPYEEFVGLGEIASGIEGLDSVLSVAYRGHVPGAMQQFLSVLGAALSRGHTTPSKADLVAMIAAAVPELHHNETGRNLDQRL
ncbi:polysaccharide biosynthesis protein [Radicibacter daui]|uniref:polysaccharide biosynthesis protein n=1 Tax=Radicibacter daui TaxID=3064829 RepID=UPI00404699BE